MSTKQESLVKEIKRVIYDNSLLLPVFSAGMDFSCAKRVKRHLEREGSGVTIVEDGIVDYDAEIQAQACNAGLQNIIRLQTMRYGTIDNAIARNKDKQVFADVSDVPLTVAEQSEFVNATQKEVDALCAKLGLSKEDLMKANRDFLAGKLEALNKTSSEDAVASTLGGNKNA